MEWSPGILALIGTIFGGVGLKLVETWLGRAKVKQDDAAQIRGELRQQLTAQREEIEQLEAAVEKWRAMYYDLRDVKMKLEIELSHALQQIKQQSNKAQRIVDEQSP
jgi:hypothetical protein